MPKAQKKEYAITIWLNEEQLDALNDYCEMYGYCKSQFVRTLIWRTIKNYRKEIKWKF